MSMHKYAYVEQTLYMAILSQESAKGNSLIACGLWNAIGGARMERRRGHKSMMQMRGQRRGVTVRARMYAPVLRMIRARPGITVWRLAVELGCTTMAVRCAVDQMGFLYEDDGGGLYVADWAREGEI